MKIALASDHGGFSLRQNIKKHLEDKNIEVIDLGTHSLDSVDYPDFGHRAAQAVIKGEADKAIIVCGTGIGISIAANKVTGIRCALCTDTFSARMSIEHNNANVLALGERVLGQGLALEIVDAWLEASFQGGRHATRVNKITQIEKDYSKQQ